MIDDVAYFSKCGDREINQDAIYVSAGKNRGIFVVADGMGGHFGGEIASSAIVNGIKNWWESNDFRTAETEADIVVEQCGKLLRNINAEVFSCFCKKNRTGGSTVVVLILWDNRYAVLSAGDSRAYRVREKILEQLTKDDVWENLPEVKYKMSDETVVRDSRFGSLTQALGSRERLGINRQDGMLSEKDIFLLCSDGVYKYCAQGELAKIMCGHPALRSAEKIQKKLQRRVKKAGADDNYSAVVCCTKM